MGAKVSVDSASLMNKGLELIEAHHLFGLPASQLDVLVHPQSIVHALVRYRDGGVVAGLSTADMRIPIAHCLGWPGRMEWPAPRLDLAQMGSLTFEAPDLERFPALSLARAALLAGGAAPTVLNAANEVAVAAFLAGRLPFNSIVPSVARVMELPAARSLAEPKTISESLTIDHIARKYAAEALLEFAVKAS
jgi:1-deoxy-D-xylulose-5-phosphate reductoisomerase